MIRNSFVFLGKMLRSHSTPDSAYSPSCSICPSVGLFLSEDFVFFLRSGTTYSGGGSDDAFPGQLFYRLYYEAIFAYFSLARMNSGHYLRPEPTDRTQRGQIAAAT